jgi:hypothetical protein
VLHYDWTKNGGQVTARTVAQYRKAVKYVVSHKPAISVRSLDTSQSAQEVVGVNNDIVCAELRLYANCERI